MPRELDDFIRGLDEDSGLSDDPFNIGIGGLDDDDLKLLTPPRPIKPTTSKPKPAPRKRAAPKRKS